ncbi:MAG TPA: cyclic pyranopterin monophosphate synthase MoaC [Candidatus Omnitrophota bacterium]|nr:cyclic pyranopterin monophosphate synthase MoaC [Candidatus Omnitrophota bacterium]
MTTKRHKQTGGMIDVSEKRVTTRIARASSTIQLPPKAFKALMEGRSPKGDVWATAKIAAIMAAKLTPDLIPMCHPLALTSVTVTFSVDKSRKRVVTISEVICRGRTGVEMEALTAASVASLTIYDMMKWADKGCVILDTKLLLKSGGESGDYNA